MKTNTETSLDTELSLLKARFEKTEQENVVLKQQLSELRRLIFGSKSERFIASEIEASQLGLFQEDNSKETIVEKEEIVYTRNKPKEKKVPVRTVLPAHLPRVEEIIEPASLADNAVKIGEQVTEVLEYNPAKLFVRKIVRPKYAIKNQNKIIIGELPSLPLPKANAGASLLANILVSKFVDHLPFYRQRQIFKRQQFEVSDATLSG